VNRTEYANAVRICGPESILHGTCLPMTPRGFDNIASALTVSSTLVEAYVSAMAKSVALRLATDDAESESHRVPETPVVITLKDSPGTRAACL
jgi:hypothetical protein